jgi:NADH:ubiquinone oxidoreductase subunit 6 (subunit J)
MVNASDVIPCALPLAQSGTAASLLFYGMALLAGASAIGVVVTRDIVRMAVFLLGTLAGVAGLYFTLEAEFLAAVQLVVYVGGTLILIVFGVMLTSKVPFGRLVPNRLEVVVSLGIGAVLLTTLVVAIWAAVADNVFAQHPMPADGYPMRTMGEALLGDYLVPFEIASVLLLAVMIGAAYMAKARRRTTTDAAATNPKPEL